MEKEEFHQENMQTPHIYKARMLHKQERILIAVILMVKSVIKPDNTVCFSGTPYISRGSTYTLQLSDSMNLVILSIFDM